MPRDAAAQRLLGLVTSGSLSMAVCVAACLRLPDLLGDAPRGAEELAREAGCHAPSLQRLLRALCSLDLCEEHADGRFTLKAAGRLLRSDAADSLRSWMIWWGRYMWPVWERLLDSVTTGKSGRRLLTGAEDFRHLEKDAEAAECFNGAMAEFTRLVAEEVLTRCDFSGCRRIVDVGGGHGLLLANVLAACPVACGVLLELPHALAGARALIERAGLTERCTLVSGDFFRGVPDEGDLYLLKAVLHDWDDEQCGTILRNCRRAMAPGGRVAVIERVMPERVCASPVHEAIARSDLNMLLAQGGRERSEAELRSLFEGAGLRVQRVVATALEYSIVEGGPV